MIDGDRRPTAQEIEELIDLVRRDPASPAFIDLGEAYLALGRPRDAVQVGNVGLQAAPDSLEGRVMLARAHAAQHQWKEAQGELLRVVKVDRTNRQGFALLGEVLLRRSDYERAVPVLQHAQNLDPTSPSILAMLKRARAGQGLDPPPPIPTPVPPRGETGNGASAAPPRRAPKPSAPPPSGSIGGRDPSALFPELDSEPPAPLPSAVASYTSPAPASSPPSRGPKQTAPPPMSLEGVRPRVVSAARTQNAAAAALRQSAAVGENYLNELLTGGLLEVAGVRVPDEEFDLKPDRRWGRSTRRAFVFLFVVLVLGIGGGGTWYWWSEKQKAEAVARLQKESQVSIIYGDFAGLELSLKKLGDSLDKDNANTLTFAYVVQTAGLEALLYGTDADRVDRAYKSAVAEIKPEAKGYRELLIGKAAVELSRLGVGDDAKAGNSKQALADVMKSLEELLAKDGNDKWALWLKGRALLAAGERKAGKASLKAAQEGADGLVPAMIDYADLLTDDGQLDEAIKRYDAVTLASKDHPLAVVGRSLARAEAGVATDEAMGELMVKLDKNLGPRVGAYRNLGLAIANNAIEDFTKANESLRKSTAQRPPNEPRFWARVAWVHYTNGKFADVVGARGRIAWYGKGKPEDDPTVVIVDAGLELAGGRPDKALDLATKIEGVRPRLIRVYAMLDLGKAKEALGESEELLKLAPENVEAQILHEEARAIAGDAKQRTEALEELEKLARNAKSKLGRHAMGMTQLATKDPKLLPLAKENLMKAVTDVSEASPNPLAYRTHTALAEILLGQDDVPGAGGQLDAGLLANSGYLPSRILQARIKLRINLPDEALSVLGALNEDELSPADTLLKIEAVFRSTTVDAKVVGAAMEKLRSMSATFEPKTEVCRVAMVKDPTGKVCEELQLPAPAEAPEGGGPSLSPAPGPVPVPKKEKRRGRR